MSLKQCEKEMKNDNKEKILIYVKNKPDVVILAIPLIGAVISVIWNFFMFLYKKGWAVYFRIPDEYILTGNSFSLYDVVVMGVIFLAYSGVAVLTVRMWLRKERLIRRFGFTVVFPMLFMFVLVITKLEDPMAIFSISDREWVYVICKLLLAVLTFHIPLVIAIGYCLFYPVHDDIIQRKKRIGRGKKECEKDRKPQYKRRRYRTHRDRNIMAWTFIALVLSLYFGLAIVNGYRDAAKKRKFEGTYIDEKLYVCVMSDGSSMVLMQGDKKEETLTIDSGHYMKAKAEGHLMQAIECGQFKVD